MARKTCVNKNSYRQFKGNGKLIHRWLEEKELGYAWRKYFEKL
jgi:hypothetical protein